MRTIVLLISLLFVTESNACRLRIIDINEMLKDSKSVSIGVVTKASSVEAETIIQDGYLASQTQKQDDEEKFLIGCGICHSSYQTINIKVTSQYKVKGTPRQSYDIDFKACIDQSVYSLFSKVAIFDSGEDIRWKLLTDDEYKDLKNKK